MYENRSGLVWKPNAISFKKAIEDVKLNFKVVDNVISDKHVTSFITYENKPKTVQSQLTNMIVYDIETLNTERVIPCAICIYRLKKISGKYNRDKTQREYEKCEKDFIVFKGPYSMNEMLDHIYNSKEKLEKLMIKVLNVVCFGSQWI